MLEPIALPVITLPVCAVELPATDIPYCDLTHVLLEIVRFVLAASATFPIVVPLPAKTPA